ncbi:putative FAD binding-containing protein [Coleophoma cylindrospora]|uniref:Putative FAD binding-containing protein n=1 Tax=Coleophoma cylindrospora TaxID=1849047 RepID=A0A3D8RHD1_9HELO|nr:putative FAD binding-containing protein [Coleophoma cylindrospora]
MRPAVFTSSAAAALLSTFFLCGTALSTETLQSNPCKILADTRLSDHLLYPYEAEYNESISTYYSGTVQAVKPWCILQPQTTSEVSLAVKALSSAYGGDWAVAIRGGGHAVFPGANNVQSGVVFDLSLMNSTVFQACSTQRTPCAASSPDGAITSVGPGARWGPVYEVVEQYGMGVAGGREGHVGVSGLVLGGGFSYYAGTRGLACDGVVNYEVVLASGSVINANPKSNADLFKALKGGSNNLGIVTRYDLDTFPVPGFYGGITAFDYSQKDALVAQLIRMIDINDQNPNDAEFISFSWSPATGDPTLSLISASVDGNPNSTSFAPLNNMTALFNSRGPTTYGTLATELESETGQRNVWYTLSFHNTLDMMNKAVQVFEDLTNDLASQAAGSFNMIFVFQPLSKQFASRSADNVLGLDKTLTTNSIVLQTEALMDTLEIQNLLSAKLANATAVIEAYAKATNQYTPWIYLNYANPSQDPIGSYGVANVNLLKRASAKYDPKGFFQKRVSGGFKL